MASNPESHFSREMQCLPRASKILLDAPELRGRGCEGGWRSVEGGRRTKTVRFRSAVAQSDCTNGSGGRGAAFRFAEHGPEDLVPDGVAFFVEVELVVAEELFAGLTVGV